MLLQIRTPELGCFNFLKDFIYLFLERGEGKEKERERNIDVWLLPARPLLGPGLHATQAFALTGNRTGDVLKAGTQSTEPHQPG